MRDLHEYHCATCLAKERGSEELAAVEIVEAGIRHVVKLLTMHPNNHAASTALHMSPRAIVTIRSLGVGRKTLVELLVNQLGISGLNYSKLDRALAWMKATGAYEHAVLELKAEGERDRKHMSLNAEAGGEKHVG